VKIAFHLHIRYDHNLNKTFNFSYAYPLYYFLWFPHVFGKCANAFFISGIILKSALGVKGKLVKNSLRCRGKTRTPCDGKKNSLQCRELTGKEARVKSRGLLYDAQLEVVG
jgi:hypothetical protein